jgi:hypothetical protein
MICHKYITICFKVPLPGGVRGGFLLTSKFQHKKITFIMFIYLLRALRQAADWFFCSFSFKCSFLLLAVGQAPELYCVDKLKNRSPKIICSLEFSLVTFFVPRQRK